MSTNRREDSSAVSFHILNEEKTNGSMLRAEIIAEYFDSCETTSDPSISSRSSGSIAVCNKIIQSEKNTLEECCHLSNFESSSINDSEQLKNRSELMKTPKTSLKKCRSCNFKKRCCVMMRSNCTASSRTCYACNKKGHYPKSLNCKKTRKIMRRSKPVCQELNKLQPFGTGYLEGDSSRLTLVSEKIVERFGSDVFQNLQFDIPGCMILTYADGSIQDVEIDDCKSEVLNDRLSNLSKMCLVFDEYRISQLDGFEDALTDSSDSDLVFEENFIPQYDGLDADQLKQVKTVFGINCEVEEIIHLINFIRSFNFIWISSTGHSLCFIDEACFFCCLRSSILRLRLERKKGPMLLKLNEFICKLEEYESSLKFNFLQNLFDPAACIENTFRLVNKCVGISSTISSCCKG